jgi:hypothetical protein
LIEFYEYLRTIRTSERYQSDILKVCTRPIIQILWK